MEQQLQEFWQSALTFVEAEILTWPRAIEFAALILNFFIARYAGAKAQLLADTWHGRVPYGWQRTVLEEIRYLLPVLVGLILLWVAEGSLKAAGLDATLQGIVVLLVLAFIAIQVAGLLVRDPFARKAITWGAWGLAALSIVGWLDPVLVALEAIGFEIGDVRLSVLSVLQGAGALIVLLWLSTALSVAAESRLSRFPAITPTTQVFFAKILRIALIAAAVLIALTSVGIDITALAVFGGALGVGIGLGLQKVVSNFVSGFILLADKSIKPGDVLEVGEAYGAINRLGARYVSMITRDGKEFLIPNEDLITQTVINWSFSDRAVRVRLPIGISYDSDVRKAMALAIEAAQAEQRVLTHPEVKCLLVGFGDSSVDLELRVWIADPEDGVRNISSAVLLRIWDAFHENGITFPFPRRDVQILPSIEDRTS